MLRILGVFAVLLVLGVAAWILHERWEHTRYRFDQKHGYWLIREQVPMSRGWFEGLAHYERLFDRSVDLGIVERFSIAPDGSYAVLGRGRAVMLYSRAGRTLDTLLVDTSGVGISTWEFSPGRLRFDLGGRRDTVLDLKPRSLTRSSEVTR